MERRETLFLAYHKELLPIRLLAPHANRQLDLLADILKKAQASRNPDLWAMAFMVIGGLGIFLLGMKNMSEGMQAVAGARLRRMISAVTDNRLAAVGAGTAVTCLVQSSTITTVIVVGFVNGGLMMLHQAVGVIMGANIGTTITAWLASIGATTNAKRAAYFHVIFNVVGVIWITAVFAPYIRGIGAFVEAGTGANPIGLSYRDTDDKLFYAQVVTAAIAATHSGCNIANTILFLPLARWVTRVLERVIPDPQVKEIPHLTRLDIRLVESPVIAIEQVRGEVLKMATGVFEMMDGCRALLTQAKPDEPLVQKVLHREKIMDNVQHEIIAFTTDLLSGQVPHAVAEEGRELLRAADEYESISDYVSTVLKSHLRLVHGKMQMEGSDLQAILGLHDEVAAYVRMITAAFEHRQKDVVTKAETRSQGITRRFKDLREMHLHRLSREKVDPVYSMSYNAILTAYRKIKEHALNIAEGLAGQK